MAEKTVGTLQASIEYRAEGLARAEAGAVLGTIRAAYNRTDGNPHIVLTTGYQGVTATPFEGREGIQELRIPFSQVISILETKLKDWLLKKHIEEQTSRLLGLVDQVEEIANSQQQ